MTLPSEPPSTSVPTSLTVKTASTSETKSKIPVTNGNENIKPEGEDELTIFEGRYPWYQFNLIGCHQHCWYVAHGRPEVKPVQNCIFWSYQNVSFTDLFFGLASVILITLTVNKIKHKGNRLNDWIFGQAIADVHEVLMNLQLGSKIVWLKCE